MYCFNVCWAGSAVFSAVSDGLTCLAGERPVVDDEQARVAETLKKLHRGDMDIVAYEDEHKFDGDVYFYLELMEGQRNRAARVLANPFRQRALGRVAELGDDLPDGHALREIQVNGPAPILYRKHADSNPDAKTSNFPSAHYHVW